jgi:two-component system, NtrC family, sensor kinase
MLDRAPVLPDGLPLPLLETILDAIPAPIFFKDAAGVYRGCNRAFQAYLGLPRAAIIGRSVEQIAPPELAAIYRRADDALLRAGGVQSYETRVRAGDGRTMDVVFHKATVTDATGSVVGLVGTYLDITEQKRAERALRESEQRLQLVLEATDQVSWDLDVRSGRIVAGPQIARLLGRGPETLPTADAALALVHPEDAARVRAAFRAHLAGEATSVELECRLRHVSGEWRWFLVAARCVEHDPAGPRRMVGTSVEITRTKMMQERLLRSDKLASIGTLAAGLAHEVSNPLAAVAANVEFAAGALLALASSEPRVAEAAGALADARAGVTRVARIVQDLRAFSRPGELHERLDLREVARSSLNLVRGELNGRCALALDLAEAPPVVGDAVRLGQVVVNLLVNAAQALPASGGELRVSTGTADDGRAFVEVADDGCGIRPDVLPRIFDPFFTTKPPGVGTGLGLFLCHRTISSMDGELRVKSEAGRGSAFRVLLAPALG